MKAWGSPNVGAPSYAQCRGPREAGFTAHLRRRRSARPSPSTSPTPVSSRSSAATWARTCTTPRCRSWPRRSARAPSWWWSIPRFSVAAGKARYWLPIKPGTDIALLLAWMNVILEEKRYDAEYLAQHAVGLDELKAHVAGQDAGVGLSHHRHRSPSSSATSARLIARARPASLIHPGRHTTWYGDDTQRARAMAILAALLGSWGRRGGYLATGEVPARRLSARRSRPRTRAAEGRGRQAEGGRVPRRERGARLGPVRRDEAGPRPLRPQGLDRLRLNLMQALPAPQETIEGHPEPRLHRGHRRPAGRDLRLGRRGAARGDLPRARRRRLARPPTSGRSSRIRQEAVPPLVRLEAGLVDREGARRTGSASARSSRGRTRASTWTTRLARRRLDVAEVARRRAWCWAKPVATCEEEGRAVAISTDRRQDRAAAARSSARLGLRSAAALLPAGGGAARARSACSSGRAPTHTFGRTINNRLLAEPYPENEVWVNADAARALPVRRRSRTATGWCS